MSDREIAKIVARAFSKMIAGFTLQTPEGRREMAEIMLSVLFEEVGGCPMKLMEVSMFLDEVRKELQAEGNGTAEPKYRTPSLDDTLPQGRG